METVQYIFVIYYFFIFLVNNKYQAATEGCGLGSSFKFFIVLHCLQKVNKHSLQECRNKKHKQIS